MIETNIFELGKIQDSTLKFAVIISKFNSKFLYVRHKERQTWEIPGGHREYEEAIDDTAKRELMEETGAVKFDIKPICDYSVKRGQDDESYGRVYYGCIYKLGQLPDFEIQEVKLFDEIPMELTYPEIQPVLLRAVERMLTDRKGD